MPLLFLGLLGLGAVGGWKANGFITPQEAHQPDNNSLNLTKVAGYAIAGGLVFYFGKKLIK